MSGKNNHREWPVTLVWAVLVFASLIGFVLVEAHAAPRLAASAAIMLAAIKVHIVFGQYMELRWHHRPLRQLLAAWLAIVTAILLVTCWLA